MSQGDGQRSVYGLAQLPIIKLSLIGEERVRNL